MMVGRSLCSNNKSNWNKAQYDDEILFDFCKCADNTLEIVVKAKPDVFNHNLKLFLDYTRKFDLERFYSAAFAKGQRVGSIYVYKIRYNGRPR